MLSRNEFEARLAEHIHGELPAHQQQEIAEYLLAHPEAAGLERDLRTLVEAGREAAGASVPDELVSSIQLTLSARLHRHIDEEAVSLQEGVPQDGRSNTPVRLRETRPARRWLTRKNGLAGAAVLAAALVLYLFAQELSRFRAFAETLSHLSKVRSFRVEGTILAPGGGYQPFRMWLRMPSSFRVELRRPGHQTITVKKDGMRLIFCEEEKRYYVPNPTAAYASGWDAR